MPFLCVLARSVYCAHRVISLRVVCMCDKWLDFQFYKFFFFFASLLARKPATPLTRERETPPRFPVTNFNRQNASLKSDGCVGGAQNCTARSRGRQYRALSPRRDPFPPRVKPHIRFRIRLNSTFHNEITKNSMTFFFF